MEPFVTASTASTADGRYAVHLVIRDRFPTYRSQKVGAYADKTRARHMGHVMVNYLREVLTREAFIDDRHIADAQRHSELLRTV